MRLPKLKGIIKRRLLINFRADPHVIQKILPPPFRPKLHQGFSIVGICLIRLEQIRPTGFPVWLGFCSENAAHRLAVEWTDREGVLQEGVFIPRRDTNSHLNHLAGGRIFPGEHHLAKFSVMDQMAEVKLYMDSLDKAVSLQVKGSEAKSLPDSSCFSSLEEASTFFEKGCLGYSVTAQSDRLDGLCLRAFDWSVQPFDTDEVYTSYFSDTQKFPANSIVFDHTLIMRNISHEWHAIKALD